ncbi:hypothetical protein PVAND_015809 [Polypedilum vanderplanki]|uniref:Chitin-binding type-2 domain-containing protein n=1 Tax=Polypedilum vanderplanki TaxID=319348 RepID=A0A9J6BE15_POLVA|nr:hypothetical protein PVAND_015809 [Polypedilum vanderplanki]
MNLFKYIFLIFCIKEALTETPFSIDVLMDYCNKAIDSAMTACFTSPGCPGDLSNPTSSPAQVYICRTGNIRNCPGPTPYCYNNKCSQGNPLCDSSVITSSFPCPDVGYYPDPNDCLKYYVCQTTSTGIVATSSSCPKGYGFYPYSTNGVPCRRGSFYCVTAKCRPGITEWRTLNYYNGTQDQYGLLCDNNGAGDFYACPAGLSIDTSDTTGVSCIVKCRRENQKAVYEGDTTRFWICLGGEAFVSSCEGALNFDPKTLSCK